MSLADVLHTLIDLAPVRTESQLRELHETVTREFAAGAHDGDAVDTAADAGTDADTAEPKLKSK